MAQQGTNRPFRALAPRTSSIPESPASGSATEDVKTKRASTACKECKKRRTRCSTGIPCTECATHNRECIYDELADKRRKVAAKHAQEELNRYKGFVKQLLEAIRYCEREHVDNIIEVIRNGATLEEISTVVERNLNEVRQIEGVNEEEEEDVDECDEDLIGRLEGRALILLFGKSGLEIIESTDPSPSTSYGGYPSFDASHQE